MTLIKFSKVNGNECEGEIDYEIKKYLEYSVMVLNLIFIEKEYRGKGYGRILMDSLITKAKNENCRYITIELPDEEYNTYLPYRERRRFFEHFGFKFDNEGTKGILKISYS